MGVACRDEPTENYHLTAVHKAFYHLLVNLGHFQMHPATVFRRKTT